MKYSLSMKEINMIINKAILTGIVCVSLLANVSAATRQEYLDTCKLAPDCEVKEAEIVQWLEVSYTAIEDVLNDVPYLDVIAKDFCEASKEMKKRQALVVKLDNKINVYGCKEAEWSGWIKINNGISF